jgi:hypothetical protein
MHDPFPEPLPVPLETLVTSTLKSAVFQRPAEGDVFERLAYITPFLKIPSFDGKPSLAFRRWEEPIRVVPIGNRLRVGRSPEAEITFPDMREISRLHFTITADDVDFILTDTTSSNGTFIRGRTRRIERHVLVNGDVIEAGGIAFVFIRA